MPEQLLLKNNQQDRGYGALGCRKSPNVEDIADYLGEIHKELGADTLFEEDIQALIHVYILLGSKLSEENYFNESFYVLTQDLRLVLSEDVIEADAPWFLDRIEKDKIHLF